jgi:hypothetical protein
LSFGWPPAEAYWLSPASILLISASFWLCWSLRLTGLPSLRALDREQSTRVWNHPAHSPVTS